jgi:hypothetical protein
VLHDVFALPFEQIAGIVDRTPNAARLAALDDPVGSQHLFGVGYGRCVTAGTPSRR